MEEAVTQTLAAKVGLSQSAVVRIWRTFGLQPLGRTIVARSRPFEISEE